MSISVATSFGYIVLHITIAYVSNLLVESYPPNLHDSSSPNKCKPSGDSKESGMN